MKLINRNSSLYFVLAPIKQYWRIAKHKSLWRKANSHNLTQAVNVFPIDRVIVGKYTYGDIQYYYFGGEHESLKIGSFCSIAGDVKFLGGGEHPVNQLFTFPIIRHIYREDAGEDTKGGIEVGDDVWIGDGATILSGVRIGQGAIIGAKSIVTKDVPPYAIWVGNRILKYRFEGSIIDKLAKLDLTTIDFDAYRTFCKKEITIENVDMMISSIVKRNE